MVVAMSEPARHARFALQCTEVEASLQARIGGLENEQDKLLRQVRRAGHSHTCQSDCTTKAALFKTRCVGITLEILCSEYDSCPAVPS